MRLRRAEDSEQDVRLARLRPNPRPDLGRDCLTFLGPPPLPPPRGAAAAITSGPPFPPLPLPSRQAPPSPPPPAKATTSSMTSEDLAQRLRLQHLDRQVALVRASPSSAHGGETGAASRDLGRAAASFLRSGPATSSSLLACSSSSASSASAGTAFSSPWWGLRAREVDGALAARVAALRASLEARDGERAAAAAARVSAACARASSEHQQRCGKQHQHQHQHAFPPFGGAGMLQALPKRPPATAAAAAARSSAASAATTAPPPALPLLALQAQKEGPVRFTRAQRREVERVAALERVWEAHRHVLVLVGAAQ